MNELRTGFLTDLGIAVWDAEDKALQWLKTSKISRLTIDDTETDEAFRMVLNARPASLQELTLNIGRIDIDDMELLPTNVPLRLSMRPRFNISARMAKIMKRLKLVNLVLDLDLSDMDRNVLRKLVVEQQFVIRTSEPIDDWGHVPCTHLETFRWSERDKNLRGAGPCYQKISRSTKWTDDGIRVLTHQMPRLESVSSFESCPVPICFPAHTTWLRVFHFPGRWMTDKEIKALPACIESLMICVDKTASTRNLARMTQLRYLDICCDRLECSFLTSQLTTLRVGNTSAVTHLCMPDMDQLPTSLVKMSIYHLNHSGDAELKPPEIAHVARLTRLQRLILKNCVMNTRNIGRLAALHDLCYLSLDDLIVSPEEMTKHFPPKTTFPMLRQLRLTDTRPLQMKQEWAKREVEATIRIKSALAF